jgi:FtsP/CotA-like multicopper oxidase with cupredoxin domain
VVETTLTAEAGKTLIGDLEIDGLTFNGDYAGPVLRVHPGDLLRIHLLNHLSEPTNLHFHGMRTSPLGNSDNVHLSVSAGGTFTYEVLIPLSQPPGLYWYHSHAHGLSEHQVLYGLSGALIVEGPLPPGLETAAQRYFVLKDTTFDDDTGNETIDGPLHGLIASINGKLDTNETMHPGEAQLWHFGNQSANLAIHLALEGHRFRIVSVDGVPAVIQPVVDVLDIMPAGRFAAVVEGGEAGIYALTSKGVMTGSGANRTPDRVMGHLKVAGEPVPTAQPGPAPAGLPDLRSAKIDARRTVVFNQSKALDPDKQEFYVNGIKFDANRVDFRIPLGSTEEWTVRNDSDDLHVFHIHQISFQVIEVNGKPVPFSGHVDTVRIPERGEVKLVLPFTDPIIVGRFMFHCHVLRHEDHGMMAQVEVFDPKPSPASDRLWRLYLHVWWWAHGVPWSLCGLGWT